MKKILILFLAISFYSNAQFDNHQLLYDYNFDYRENKVLRFGDYK